MDIGIKVLSIQRRYHDNSSIKTLEQLFEDHIKDYKLGIRYGASDGRSLYWTQGACHADMSAMSAWLPSKYKIQRFYSQLRCGEDERKEAEAYWTHILDEKTSPWRCVLKDVCLHRDKRGRLIAWSTAIDDSTSQQTLVNLCIASRKPAEVLNFASMYDNLLGLLEPNEAILAMHFVSVAADVKSVLLLPSELGHHCISFGLDVTKFLNSKPRYDKSLMTAKMSTYYPCNEIWGRGTNIHKELLKNCSNYKTVKENDLLFKKVLKAYNKNLHTYGRIDYATYAKAFKETINAAQDRR